MALSLNRFFYSFNIVSVLNLQRVQFSHLSGVLVVFVFAQIDFLLQANIADFVLAGCVRVVEEVLLDNCLQILPSIILRLARVLTIGVIIRSSRKWLRAFILRRET